MYYKINAKRPIAVIIFLFTIFFVDSCKLAESPIEPTPTVPTRDVRYVVTMSTSSSSSSPQISYTNVNGGTTTITDLSLDLTLPIDSGTTVNLSASCTGYYTAASGNSSAAIDIKLYVDDTLAADSSIIKTDNLLPVAVDASVSAGQKFNDAINNQDIDTLSSLMTDDHAFIDRAGTTVKGKQAMTEGWINFFNSFSDYRNYFEKFIVRDDTVFVTGYSTCLEKLLTGKFLWTAKIINGLIDEWRVYEDNNDNRKQLGLAKK